MSDWKEEQRKLAQRARMGRFHNTGKPETGKIHKFSNGLFEVDQNGSYRRVTQSRALELLKGV